MNNTQLDGLTQNDQNLITQLTSVDSSVSSILIPVVIGGTIISALFLVFYIISIVRRWKVQRAIFDIQKNVNAMNERTLTTTSADETPKTPPTPVELPQAEPDFHKPEDS